MVTLGTGVYSLNMATGFYNHLEKTPLVQDINKLIKEGKYELSKIDIKDYFNSKEKTKKEDKHNDKQK